MEVIKVSINVETTPERTLTLKEAQSLLMAALDAAIDAEGIIVLHTPPYDRSDRLAELRRLRGGCDVP